MSQMWQEALSQLREQLGQQNFETWIKPIRAREASDDEILLEVPNKFFRDWLAEHFLRSIHDTLALAARHDVKISLAVNQTLQTSAAAPPLERRAVERGAPTPLRARSPISLASITTRCSSTAESASGRPISSTRSATASRKGAPRTRSFT